MDRDALQEFIRRDWSSIAASKARFWHEFKARRSAHEVLAATDLLRVHALSLRPDWPTLQHRRDDLLVHQRVGEALRAVARRPR